MLLQMMMLYAVIMIDMEMLIIMMVVIVLMIQMKVMITADGDNDSDRCPDNPVGVNELNGRSLSSEVSVQEQYGNFIQGVEDNNSIIIIFHSLNEITILFLY